MRSVLVLFSSVTLGISLLVCLFVYMALGSAGAVFPIGWNVWSDEAWVHAQVRQWPAFDMTEFEWFHWWPFDLLLGLIAANIIVTTIQRIPFKVVNYGVWMIHSGIILLLVGSVIYFGTKVEGDAPVAMRRLIAHLDGSGGSSGSFVVSPGQMIQLGTAQDPWTITVQSIDPEWALLSGENTGLRTYSVTVLVEGNGRRFMRQLVAGFPEYTEDLVFSDDVAQPVKRARKETGNPIIEPRLALALEYESQKWFYLRNDLAKSWALYVRTPGGAWHERPLEGMPLYNDHVADHASVFSTSTEVIQVGDGLSVMARPTDLSDPFPDLTLQVDSYLRYAQDRVRWSGGGVQTPLNPMIWLSSSSTAAGSDSTPQVTRLSALNPTERVAEGGFLRFDWVFNEDEFARLTRIPSMEITIPGESAAIVVPVQPSAATDQSGDSQPPDADGFRLIGNPSLGFAYKVIASQQDLKLEGRSTSVAIVEFRTPRGTTRRWVFDLLDLCRDVGFDGTMYDAPKPVSDEFSALFTPSRGDALVTFVAGPGERQLRVVTGEGKAVKVQPIEQGGVFNLPAGIAIEVVQYVQRAVQETRPSIVPVSQRSRDARELFAQIRLIDPDGHSHWIHYSPYPFENQLEVLRRHPFEPASITLQDGRVVELLFSRQRVRLGAEVALDRFSLTSHIGGFTGETSSIRDYTSMVRFRDDVSAGWTEPVAVSVNAPVEHNGLWFFQAQWDPPEPPRAEGDMPSLGRNYTVLGVATRQGVGIQLAGCIVAVIGMIYAFYVKPTLRRKQSEQSKAKGASIRPSTGATSAALIALVTLLTIGLPAAPSHGDEAPSFAELVDLTPLESVAVHTEGRLKSFGSFAHQMMGYVSGPRRIAGQSNEFTYLDLLIRPKAYDDADIIYVKGKHNRVPIADALVAADGSLSERMNTFVESGLISEELLSRRESQRVLQEMQGDLIRTAKVVDQIEQALAVRDQQLLLRQLRVIPPGSKEASAPWHGISEVMLLAVDPAQVQATGMTAQLLPDIAEERQMAVSVAWRELVEGWSQGDATITNQAVRHFAVALAAVHPEVYPDANRLAWETWYFHQGNLVWIWLVYMASVIFLLLGTIYRWVAARRIGLCIFVVAFLLHTAALLLRWWISGRWPNSNMFEAVTTSVWFGGALALVLEPFLRRRATAGVVALCSAVASMVALMSAHFLPAELNANISNMMPVLHDVWLYIHTNVIIFSYALIFMAAVTAFLYLAYRYLGGPATYAKAGGAAEVLLSTGIERADGRGRLGEILDGVTMLLMELSFVMLWAGLVMGAIWADHSWGRPWGWDPKEVFALNTFVVFVLLIHVRMKVHDKGFWTAILAVLGALVMLFNWIVINFVITGLHSYA